MGNVYKDEAGHFTNKENNGGPCKHKRIAGGKYEYSEDGGKTWNAFEKREDYDAYETDEDERFDENNEDDFGFDEDDYNPYNEVDYNWVKDHIDDNPGIKANELIEDVKEKFGDINPEDEMEIRKIIDEEYNREMAKAQEENAAMSEGEGRQVIQYDKEDAERFKNAGFDVASEEETNEIFGNNGNKVKIGDREMTLDEWNNKMKNASDKEMAREFMLIHASKFNMSENEMEEYLKNNFDENEENKVNPDESEKSSDEGINQEEKLAKAEEALGYRSHESEVSEDELRERFKEDYYITENAGGSPKTLLIINKKTGKHVGTYHPDTGKLTEFEWLQGK